MKRIGIIEKISPLTTIEVTQTNGEKKPLFKQGIIVSLGKQSVYVEFIDNYDKAAKELAAKIAVGQVVQVDYDSFVREFTDKTGATRYENRLTGRDLQIFSDRAF